MDASGSLGAKKDLAFELSKRKFVKIRFSDMRKYSKTISERILKTHGPPDVILYAQRGGMVIARLLSDLLDVRDMACISARYYSKSNKPFSKVMIGKIPKVDVDGYILLVDDIADSGKTLNAICEGLKKKSNVRVVTCTFGMKPQSVITPDFHAFTVNNDTWVIFEYEEREALRNFSKTGNAAGLKFMKDNF